MSVCQEDVIRIVLDEIANIPNLPDADKLLAPDIEDLAAMSAAGSNAWLPFDLRTRELISTERRFDIEVPGFGFTKFGGLTDLRLRNSDTGRCITIDWKTAGDVGAKATIERYQHSWQRKYYQYVTRDALFCYRLVQKPDAAEPTDGLAVREILFEVEDWDEHDNLVVTQLQQATKAYQSMHSWQSPWFMNAPAGCNAFNRPCPFKATCPAHGGMAPKQGISIERELKISHSAIENFWLCPERYRQGVLTAEDTSSRDAIIGKVFHSVMERIYLRAFEASGRLVEETA